MRIRVNTDMELVSEIRKALIENDGYCPCKTERIEDNRCMCKEFIEQSEGICHCGLYIKDEI
jgi:ferredoxin-thioredoxin reductase catalytic subunit